MNSDNYEFSKSASPQSVSDYSCFVDKQFNSIMILTAVFIIRKDFPQFNSI